MRKKTQEREPVFRTVQSVRPGGRTGRSAGGSPSFFESMDGLWKMRMGPDALRGPVASLPMGRGFVGLTRVHSWVGLGSLGRAPS